MTAQDAKHFLNQVYRIEERIDGLMKQMERYQDMATHITSKWGDGIHSGDAHSQVEQAVVKIVELEQEINTEIDQLIQVKRHVKKVVNQVDDPQQKMLLELRYFQYLRFPDIASRMNYSERQLLRLHGEALESVARILDPESKEEVEETPNRSSQLCLW